MTTKAEGGEHDQDSLILLCGNHHRLCDNGLLIIDGSVSKGLRFWHADGSRYGSLQPDVRAIDRFERAFGARRGLGFKDGESKRALAEVRGHVGREAGVEELVRGALAALAH